MSTATHIRPKNDPATLPRHTVHPVHLDPIEQAMSLLIGTDPDAELVCDGSCGGLASCNLAPVDHLSVAA